MAGLGFIVELDFLKGRETLQATTSSAPPLRRIAPPHRACLTGDLLSAESGRGVLGVEAVHSLPQLPGRIVVTAEERAAFHMTELGKRSSALQLIAHVEWRLILKANRYHAMANRRGSARRISRSMLSPFPKQSSSTYGTAVQKTKAGPQTSLCRSHASSPAFTPSGQWSLPLRYSPPLNAVLLPAAGEQRPERPRSGLA